MEEGAKQATTQLTPGEIVERFTQELFQHDAATQSAILDEVRAALISDYSHKRDGHFKTANELEHSIDILRGNIPMKTSPVGRDTDYVEVERKNYKGY